MLTTAGGFFVRATSAILALADDIACVGAFFPVVAVAFLGRGLSPLFYQTADVVALQAFFGGIIISKGRCHTAHQQHHRGDFKGGHDRHKNPHKLYGNNLMLTQSHRPNNTVWMTLCP